MSIQKLERVLWRLRRKFPNEKKVPWIEFKRAIMIECGTDPATYRKNRDALVALGWVKMNKKRKANLTEMDLTG